MSQLQLATTTSTVSVRERELEVGRVVLQAAMTGHPFLVRRAGELVTGLENGPARRPLRWTLEQAADGSSATPRVITGLLGYGAVLERHGEHGEAEHVYRAVLELRPRDASVALHVARAARKAGRREEALALYRHAGQCAGGDTHMQLLVATGEALVSDDPDQRLTAVIVSARRAGKRDAEAVAREERARVRLSARRGGAALRDLLAAAVRFRDAHDRVRVLHRAAELLTARGDLPAAREALLTALDVVPDAHRGHTLQRIRTVARAQGDELELRRSRGRGASPVVTLAPSPARRPAAASAVRHVRRLRDVVTPPGRTSS
ncbi:MAG TPA: tetratricopeptide repeat protein [Longimicrobiales bacterium]|nr:tetratricopeptide repeat protein [Longimicrobiales bacterium]